jgi:hypothetical protein
METQTVTVELEPSTAAILHVLQEKAKARGVTLASLLLPLTEESNGNEHERPLYETASTEEWLQAFNEWVDSHKSRDYDEVDDSRESIYTREDDAL